MLLGLLFVGKRGFHGYEEATARPSSFPMRSIEKLNNVYFVISGSILRGLGNGENGHLKREEYLDGEPKDKNKSSTLKRGAKNSQRLFTLVLLDFAFQIRWSIL